MIPFGEHGEDNFWGAILQKNWIPHAASHFEYIWNWSIGILGLILSHIECKGFKLYGALAKKISWTFRWTCSPLSSGNVHYSYYYCVKKSLLSIWLYVKMFKINVHVQPEISLLFLLLLLLHAFFFSLVWRRGD